MNDASDLWIALPEVFMAVAAMALLMFGVFRGDGATRQVSWLAVAALVVAGILVLSGPDETTIAFKGLYIDDPFADFLKILVIIGGILAIILSMSYLRVERAERFEYPVLAVLATLGMMMMVSANDLLSLYVGLELQSLALYVLAAFRRDTIKSSEAGLKYFVLGALSSGMLLYGCSMVYGFAGSTNFTVLAEIFAQGEAPSTGLVVGIVFLAAGLAFKLSAVPFHMWTPDVYEGAPTPVTTFFALAPKLAAIGLFLRLMVGPFGDLVDQWQQIIWLVALASMIWGAFAAIAQQNIKRLMAYSSIGHMGYALIGLAAGTEEGVRGVLIYVAIYLAMTAGTFACILTMRRAGQAVEGISDLAGLGRSNPMMALALGIFMFSMAGIPPLAGFFGKFYVFLAAIEAELYLLAVVGVLSSVVGAFYYLRIVKLMYFDEPVEQFDRPVGAEISVVLGVTALFTLLFVVFPAPILDGAAAAAQSLFAG